MKKIYRRLSLGFVFLLCTVFVKAQNTANYTFTTTTTGSLTDMSSATTQLIAPDQDDLASSVTNIGFDFFFNGVRQAQFTVNSNGTLRFGTTVISTTLYDPLGQAGQALITAYGTDQRTHAGDGKVHYKITGVAPNRILIVEWLNTQADFNTGGTADLTYQVRLYETTGVIEYVYGSMTMSAAGAADVNSSSPQIGFSSGNTIGTVGSVTAAQSATPAPTYNSASAAPTNNLYVAGTIPVLTSAVNGARRTFSFTPLIPADPTVLSFTAITAINMTLNWTDNATNEIGYVILRSTDGINYSFIGQVAANSVNALQTGLFEGTTYYWQVLAVTEGGLSNALTGAQATTAAGNITSNGTGGGLWNNPASWVGNIVPTSNDKVTIQDGDLVVIDVAAAAYSLSIGEGVSGTLEFEQTTARALTVYADVIINAGGTFRSSLAGTQTGHNLSLGGNLVNNGTLDFSTNADVAGAAITFTGLTNTSFSGTGATTDIRQITINKGTSSAAIVEITVTNFTVRGVTTDTVVGGWLVMTNGTIKISGTFSGTSRVFSAAGYTIPATCGIWLNNPNYTVAGQSGSPTLNGLLRISQGIFNIGTATGNSMGFAANSSVIVEGGTVNATGRFAVAAAANKINYTQSGGTITVCTIGNASATLGAFDLGTSTSSVISLSGGTIVCQLASTAIDYRNQAGTGITAITGGTLQLGNAASGAAKTFNLRGVLPNVVLTNTSANHNATMSTTLVNFNNISLDITNNGGTFNFGNTVFLFNGGTLTNNGTLTHNGASSNFVTFLTTAPQTYTGTGIVTAPMTNLSIQSNMGFTIDPASASIVANAVRIYTGNIINANKLIIGNGGTTTATIQIGNNTTPTAAGSFDQAPAFNPGTGGIALIYFRTTAARTTGPEVPASRIVTSLTINENDPLHPLTLGGGDLTVTGTFTQTSGNINLGVNTLTLGTSAIAAGTYTYTAGTLIGKFKRWITAATGNRDFPVGIAAAKRNASINFTTAPAVGGTLTAEWVPTPGGGNGMPLTEGTITAHNTSHDGFWRVVAGDGLSGGNYTGTFTATGITGVNDYAQLVLVKRADASSPWTLDGTHVTTTGSNAIPVLSRTDMAGFSEFSAAGDMVANPLPVTLLSFTAQRNDNANLIKWSTSQEINSSHFILERSSDGGNFISLTQVTAAGNSSDVRNYSYTDNNPVAGINYYRLKMVDIDNESKYSAVRTVRNEGITDVAVYPNPVNDVLNVLIAADKAGKGNMIITNMSGHVVYKKPISVGKGNNNFYVDMNQFAGGVYLIDIRVSDDRVVKKFNKL